MILKNGIDVLIAEAKYDVLKKLRWGLVTNNAAFMQSGIPARKALLKNGWNLVKLFSPEHGITAQAEDGQRQADSRDPLTGMEVESLYGSSFAPSDTSVEDLDGVLFDIPDVGCRFYTFLWTMTYVMEACAVRKKQVIILDRPNPLGRDLSMAEGPMLDETHCSSFIGRWSIPLRHCCTLGELANYFRATRFPDLDLAVVQCSNPPLLPELDPVKLLWTPPSPSLPDPLNALLYPGIGLLEGLMINEGRGTSLPFRLFGAPYMNSHELAEEINRRGPAGLAALPFSYIPSWGVYEKKWCNGVLWRVQDPSSCRPVRTMVEVIRLISTMYPGEMQEREYPTHANPAGNHHLDRLFGMAGALNVILKGDVTRYLTVAHSWKELITPYRLYREF